jgi:hypothetical protein
VTAKEQADDDVIRGLTVASFFMVYAQFILSSPWFRSDLLIPVCSVQFLWLFLEIIDIVTDFIALSRILETPTLSSYFDAYITLVSLATILSIYLVYDRSVVLYAVCFFIPTDPSSFSPCHSSQFVHVFQVLKQRFSGTLKMKVIDGIMNGEASSEYSKKQMKLQLLLAKRRGLFITIALAICEVTLTNLLIHGKFRISLLCVQDIPSVIINLLIIGSGFSSGYAISSQLHYLALLSFLALHTLSFVSVLMWSFCCRCAPIWSVWASNCVVSTLWPLSCRYRLVIGQLFLR